MKTIIRENERGLIFKNGKFVKAVGAGSYYSFLGTDIEVVNLSLPLYSENCSMEALLKNQTLAEEVSVVDVKDEQIALHFKNGNFAECLAHGQHAFWNIYDKHEFKIVDISNPEVGEDIPKYIFTKIPIKFYVRIDVNEYQKARLYFNKKLVKILDAGTYYYWQGSTKIEVSYVDTRLTQMNITGQEILTQDKVALRINFVCSYRIADCVKIVNEIDNFEEQLHVVAQLALREYVGKFKIDEILEKKEEISAYVLEKLKERERDFYVSIYSAGVKDIILPGEIRDIMNTVLIAEKRAQANVITRREEVASTRSLLNTAKLMDENNTLYKLKELEYIEKICKYVGNINVNGSGDILSQLTAALKSS